jgi:phosphoglycolate phosphatase
MEKTRMRRWFAPGTRIVKRPPGPDLLAAMRFDAILFDLDGTLADTLDDIAASMNWALEHNDLDTHPPDAYRQLVGEGVGRLVERALPAGRQDLHGAVLEDLRAHYTDHMLDRTVPYPGIPELLDELSGRGLRMAILSNKPELATRWMVERLFSRWPFAAVVGERPGVPHKPDPQAATEIARALGVPTARVLYLGDTRTDMETAVAAGMVGVGVLWGFRDRAELVAHGAAAVVEHPRDVVALLEDGVADGR